MSDNEFENKLSNVSIPQENVIKKDDKSIASDLVLEEIITRAIQVPGVKVDRSRFLAESFSSNIDKLENVINDGPIEAGISREEINAIANKLIIKRTSQSSIASFAAGIPVICSHWRYCDDLITDKENGLIYSYKDYQGLVDCIIWSINNIDEFDGMRKKSLDSYEKYDPSIAIKPLIDCIK